jgi:hypothetical protein
MKAKLAIVNDLDPRELALKISLDELKSWDRLDEPFVTYLSDVILSDPQKCLKNMKYKVLKVIYLAEN